MPSLPCHEVAHEARQPAARDAQHVVQHQHLARAAGAGTDADHRDGQALREALAQRARDQFDHQHRGARLGSSFASRSRRSAPSSSRPWMR